MAFCFFSLSLRLLSVLRIFRIKFTFFFGEVMSEEGEQAIFPTEALSLSSAIALCDAVARVPDDFMSTLFTHFVFNVLFFARFCSLDCLCVLVSTLFSFFGCTLTSSSPFTDVH